MSERNISVYEKVDALCYVPYLLTHYCGCQSDGAGLTISICDVLDCHLVSGNLLNHSVVCPVVVNLLFITLYVAAICLVSWDQFLFGEWHCQIGLIQDGF